MDPDLIGLLVVLLAPTLFWGAYHYVKDRRRPEPIRYLGFAYLLGIAAGLLGQLAYRWLDLFGLRQDVYVLAETDPGSLLLYAVVVIGGIEETVKLLPFVWIVLRLKHFDELIDGIIYASFIALGFATYENFVYARYVGGIELLARSIASPLVHVLFASVWGHLIARADCRGRPLLPAVLLGLAAAACLHGLYDFMLIGLPEVFRLLAAALLAAGWLMRMRLMQGLHRAGGPGHGRSNDGK